MQTQFGIISVIKTKKIYTYMFSKKNILFLLFLFIHATCWLQKITVINYSTNLPIEDVIVENKSGSVSYYTNENGEVFLDEFKMNELIYFSHPSFDREVKTIAQIIEASYVVYMFDEITLPVIDIKPPRENIQEDFTSVRIDEISLREIKLSVPQTSADMLQKNTNVLVQKSQSGGGSPIIRGFEANKILLVVDGVRMNNAIYRSGHLQNAITVDNNILQSTDVFYGPGSVIYGSDALGGVIHFHTKNPQFSQDSNTLFKVNYMGRFGTANGENTNHVDFNIGRKKWASLTSVTFSDYEDFEMGKNRNHGYEDFGKVFNYVKTINGKDSVIHNPDVNTHTRTAYNQLDFLQKFNYQINKNNSLGLNIQYSTSSPINRFDKLNEYRNGKLRFAEWYYGPQKRLLTSLKFESKAETKFSDYFTIIGAFQKIDEDRISRNFGSSSKFTEREDVFVYSLNADFLKKISKKEVIYYGLEFTHNDVNSNATEENIFTGETTPAQTRYPGGANQISTMALYTTFDKKITEQVTVNLGARYSHSFHYSRLSDSSFLDFPFNEIDFNTGALSGSFSVKYEEKHGFRAELIGSSGFRSPNVDDYGKVFEKNGDLIVPNDRLRPVFVYNGEINISKKWMKGERETILLKTALFYSSLTNAIIQDNFTVNEQDSVTYRGDRVNLIASQNINSAMIYGASFDARFSFTPYLQLLGAINYTLGENVTDEVPLAHIPPLFGRLALTYSTKKLQLQFAGQFNGEKRIEDYAPGASSDNPEEATADGTPAWSILNFYSSYKINSIITLQASVENIFDTHYKQFASGVSGLGRNFTFTVRANF